MEIKVITEWDDLGSSWVAGAEMVSVRCSFWHIQILADAVLAGSVSDSRGSFSENCELSRWIAGSCFRY